MLSRLRQFLSEDFLEVGLFISKPRLSAPPPLSFPRTPRERLPAGRQGLAWWSDVHRTQSRASDKWSPPLERMERVEGKESGGGRQNDSLSKTKSAVF